MKKQKEIKKEFAKIYDGAMFCDDGHCPIVEHSQKSGLIKISDPAKPQNGQFTMTVEEFNTLLANAKKVG